jgi:hypothetical protein
MLAPDGEYGVAAQVVASEVPLWAALLHERYGRHTCCFCAEPAVTPLGERCWCHRATGLEGIVHLLEVVMEYDAQLLTSAS